MRSVEEILEKIKEIKGIPSGHGSDVALSTQLNLKKQAVTNWKFRGKVVWKTLMDVLPPEEFRIVYEWAHGRELEALEVREEEAEYPSKAADGPTLKYAEQIVDDFLIQGQHLPEEKRYELISLVADELVGLRALGREGEILRKVRRWIDAAQALRSPRSNE